MRHRIDAKNSPKAASEKAKIKVYEIIQGWIYLGQSFYSFQHQQKPMCRRHIWYTRYRVPPLQSSSIAECLRSFLSAFECLIIPVV